MADDRERSLREQLTARFDPDSYDQIRGLWIAHSKAELAKDVGGLLSTLTQDCVYEISPSGHRWDGLEGARRFYTGLFEALPDLEALATDLVIGPQGVLVAAEMTGTHRGSWTGEEPTGRRVSCEFLALFPWDSEQTLFTGEKLWWAHSGGFLGVLKDAASKVTT
jgi:predicted ester cyclase